MTSEFVPLLNHDDYEILNEYPFTIRRKKDHYEISESLNGKGYVNVKLNRKNYLKHRLIAEQFLPNPLNLPCIDHVNHDRTDNHLSNLRWISSSDNQFNKSSHNGVIYEFVDEISEYSIMITDYKTRNGIRYFPRDKYYYYFDEDNNEDIFYMKVDEDMYRVMHINILNNGSQVISCIDINHQKVNVCINRFKKQYDLIDKNI